MTNGLDLGNLLIHLKADSSQYDKMMKLAEQKLLGTAKRMQSIGKSMSLYITTPLTLIGGIATKVSIDLESAFAGVRKTVDATEQDLQKLKVGFENLSTTIPIALTELYGVGEAAGQLGIKTSNIIGFTETMAKLGVTTNLSAQEAATQLARMANITQMSQNDFDRLGSTIVDLGNKFATTEREIVAMAMRLSGAGSQVGLSEAKILALAAGLSSVGLEAEAGGTAFSRLMLIMKSAVLSGTKELTTFAKVAGITKEEFQAMFKGDASKAITSFVAGLGRLNKAGVDLSPILQAVGADNIRMTDALGRAAGASELLKNALEIGANAWNENNALTKEAEKRFETTASKLQMVKNNFNLLADKMLSGFLPSIISTTNWMMKLAAYLQTLDKQTLKWITSLLGIAAAIGPVTYFSGKFLLIVSSLIKGFRYLSLGVIWVNTSFKMAAVGANTFNGSLIATYTISSLLSKSLLSITTAVSGMVAAFNGWKLGEYFSKEFKIVQQLAANFVLNLWTGWEYVKFGFKQMVAGMRIVWDSFVNFMLSTLANRIEKIANLLTSLEKTFEKLGMGAPNLGADSFQGFVDSLKGAAAKDIGQKQWEQNKKELKQALEGIQQVSDEMFLNIEKSFQKGVDSLGGVESNGITEGIKSIQGEIEKALGALSQWEPEINDDVKAVNDMLTALNTEVSLLGKSTREKEKARQIEQFRAAVQKAYLNDMQKQNELMAEFAQKLNIIQAQQDKANFSTKLKDWADSSMDIWTNMGDVAVNALDGISNKLTEFITTGKANFKEFAAAILTDLLQIMIRMQLVQALQMMPGIGGLFGGAGDAAGGAALSAAATQLTAASTILQTGATTLSASTGALTGAGTMLNSAAMIQQSNAMMGQTLNGMNMSNASLLQSGAMMNNTAGVALQSSAGLLSGAAAALTEAAIASSLSAKGNVFRAGNMVPFAKGGVIDSIKRFATGGIVASPTKFPMRDGGVGLMGEAGPEAIMPLTRTADGKLGVKAEGQGGGGQSNNVKIVNILEKGEILKALSGVAGEKVIVNAIKRNKGIVSGVLG